MALIKQINSFCTNLGCTVGDEECIFPFIHKGNTFIACTSFDSYHETPWCALKVDNQNNVIDGERKDCEKICHGKQILVFDLFLHWCWIETLRQYSRLSNKRVVWNKCVGWNLTGNLINMLDGIIMLEGKF